MNNLLTDSNTIEEAHTLWKEVTAILSRDEFNIHQWASNKKQIIDDLYLDAINTDLVLDKMVRLKTLGISWRRDDVLCYSVHTINQSEKIIKRTVISEIAKIFYSLGILSPVILYHAKLIMQDL